MHCVKKLNRENKHKIERGKFGCYDKVAPSIYLRASQKKIPVITHFLVKIVIS